MTITYSIGEFAKKTGITVRTLRYYDEIHLFKPSLVSDTGRRYYSENDFSELQKIITLKFLGYSLEEIKQFINSDKWDLKDSLLFQKNQLQKKMNQINQVMKALDHALYILEEQKQVDPGIFITLINSIQMEDVHKEWMKQYFDHNWVEEMYEILEDQRLEFDNHWIKIIQEIKEAYGLKPDDHKVQLLVEEFMGLLDKYFPTDQDFYNTLANLNLEEDNDPWFFPSPLTKEEEEWMAQAIEIYLKQKGVHFDGKSTERDTD